MLNADKTVTVIHHEKTADGDAYLCHVLRGVSWHTQNRYTVETTGQKPSRTHKIRIPFSLLGSYLDPDAFRELPDKAGFWTLAHEDKIALGEYESVTGAEFAALSRSPDACTVLDIHKNFYGHSRHIYAEGG